MASLVVRAHFSERPYRRLKSATTGRARNQVT